MLYQTLCASFCVIVVVSNILSAKMVPLPFFQLIVPAGLITYPLTFILSDLVTELFGAARARQMVYIALGMSLLSFALIQVGLMLPSAHPEEHKLFEAVMGLSSLRIFSSLISYVVSQLVDIRLYAAIKRWTGPRFLWLRNNGSTCTAQLVDTMMIDLTVLWWGLGMTLEQVMPIMIFSYLYKAFFSVACTPLFYLLVYLAKNMRKQAERTSATTELKGSTL